MKPNRLRTVKKIITMRNKVDIDVALAAPSIP
ncbi:MAG: hypothetical protein ACI8P9_004689 [Parasphingorhabdus sp.]|jgi:hypothetical protein